MRSAMVTTQHGPLGRRWGEPRVEAGGGWLRLTFGRFPSGASQGYTLPSCCHSMRRLLIAAAVIIASQVQLPASAQIDPKIKAECMKAQDFVGCMKALSGNVELKNTSEVENLRTAMKQVADRISFGTSLRESNLFFQPVIDNLALAKEKEPNSLAVRSSSKAAELYGVVQGGWQARIDSYRGGAESYSCRAVQTAIDRFNAIVGAKVIKPYSAVRNKEEDSLVGGFFDTDTCVKETALVNEGRMLAFVAGVLREGAVDPAAISKYESDRAEKIRLASFDEWQKHLESDPTLKQWAKINPKLAEQKRIKFNSENPPQLVSMPTYQETLVYISKFRPPL